MTGQWNILGAHNMWLLPCSHLVVDAGLWSPMWKWFLQCRSRKKTGKNENDNCQDGDSSNDRREGIVSSSGNCLGRRHRRVQPCERRQRGFGLSALKIRAQRAASAKGMVPRWGVGLEDFERSLPTQNVLWSYNSRSESKRNQLLSFIALNYLNRLYIGRDDNLTKQTSQAEDNWGNWMFLKKTGSFLPAGHDVTQSDWS